MTDVPPPDRKIKVRCLAPGRLNEVDAGWRTVMFDYVCATCPHLSVSSDLNRP